MSFNNRGGMWGGMWGGIINLCWKLIMGTFLRFLTKHLLRNRAFLPLFHLCSNRFSLINAVSTCSTACFIV